MSSTRQEILRLTAILSEKHPDWRFGQLVVNVANWAANPPLPESVWDVEDEELLAALQNHLELRCGLQTRQNGTMAKLDVPTTV